MVIDEASKTAAHRPRYFEIAESSSARLVLAGTLPAEELRRLLSDRGRPFLAGPARRTRHRERTAAMPSSPSAATDDRRSVLAAISTSSCCIAGGATSSGSRTPIWYTVWDTGLHLDHSVRTAAKRCEMAGSDMKVVLGLLDARHIAGDEHSRNRSSSRSRRLWQTRWNQSSGGAARTRSLERHRSSGSSHSSLNPT